MSIWARLKDTLPSTAYDLRAAADEEISDTVCRQADIEDAMVRSTEPEEGAAVAKISIAIARAREEFGQAGLPPAWRLVESALADMVSGVGEGAMVANAN